MQRVAIWMKRSKRLVEIPWVCAMAEEDMAMPKAIWRNCDFILNG